MYDLKKIHRVVYDGDCPMCRVVMNTIDTSSQKDAFQNIDSTKDALPQSLTADAVDKEIHVIGEDGTIYKGADAIITILAQYPEFAFLAKLGRLPVIKQILALGYKVVALNRHFIFGEVSRIFWIKTIVALGLIAGLSISIKLWISDRLYPLVPVIDGLPTRIFPYDYLLFGIVIGALLWVIVSPRPRTAILVFLAGALVLAITDQSRWHPWFYQYVFMMIVLASFSWNYKDVEKQNILLNTLSIVIAGIYFWSGIQKINPTFIGGIFPWMVDPFVSFLPTTIKSFLYTTAVFVPFVEMAIGIGLIIKKTRPYAVLMAIGMHIFILASLSPLGHNWNSSVWPWNIAMIVIVITLFWKRAVPTRTLFFQKNALHMIAILLFLVMPALSFFNVWDSYLSSALYSGNLNAASIEVSTETKNTLPALLQSYAKQEDSGKYSIDIKNWSMSELNVPPYSEKRIFTAIGSYVCELTNNTHDMTLTIKGKPYLITGKEPSRVFTCADLTNN